MNTEINRSTEEYRSAECMQLPRTTRERLLKAATHSVEERIWDSQFDRQGWDGAVRSHWLRVVEAEDTIAFERELNVLVSKANEFTRVASRDIGLFHERDRKRSEPRGLASRFRYCQPNECLTKPTTINESAGISSSCLENGIGWLKVTRFPGAIGIDIANDIDRAIRKLTNSNCERLILDLRGNAGGGLGFLRLMSYLTPDRVVAGYSVTRVGAEKAIPMEDLKEFDRVPSHKWALPWLIVKYGLRNPSVCIVTERLGPQPFHKRIAILVDGKTTGAGERIAAFASENHLATVIGNRTAGQLICSDSIKLGDQYFVRIPARAWYTGQGKLLENIGVAPDLEVGSGEAVQTGDAAFQKATELLCASLFRNAFISLPNPQAASQDR